LDLIKLPAVAVRRWYVIVLVVLVAVAAQGLQLATASNVYESRVRIQVTAPSADNMQLLAGSVSSSYLRDDLLLVRNNFTIISQSPEVRNRTIQELGLQGPDRDYDVSIAKITDSDYLDLVVAARTPDLAEAIANRHVRQSIRFYGELRAKPATATVDFLASQVQAAQEKITSLQEGSQNTSSGGASARSTELQQALDNYRSLLQKQADAKLVAQRAAEPSYIQVVEPAEAPAKPSWRNSLGPTMSLTLVGSLGLGLLLALLLESLFPPKTARIRPSSPGVQFVEMLVASRETDLSALPTEPAPEKRARRRENPVAAAGT
jgi:uncharacterized protein involved in exopolysaccharide biosynthesis